MRSIRRIVSPLKHLLKKRRIHAYGVGTSRSGTKSLARIFQTQYRAAHEPEALELIDTLLQASAGRVSESELARFVRRRDRRLRLEFESSQLVANILEVVVSSYPRARFILTVRHPVDWLESIVNHEIRSDENPVWTRWAVRVFQGTLEHPPPERAFKEQGLFTVTGYLGHWARHNQRVLDTVPEDRLLILRTSRISDSLGPIADYLEIPLETLDSRRSHANLGVDKIPLFSMVDRAYLREQVINTCGDVMKSLHLDALSERESSGRRGAHA